MLLTALVFAQGILPMTAAACGGGTGSSKDQVLGGVGETGSSCDSSGVTGTLSAAVSILSYVVGAAAIIMVIAAGFRYVTSGGESGAVGNAKNTLIYALVGVAIAALAQLLVHFVLTNANNNTQPCPYTIAGHPGITAGDTLCVKPKPK